MTETTRRRQVRYTDGTYSREVEELPTDTSDMRCCSRCGKIFSSRKGADMHIQQVHGGVGRRVPVRRYEGNESMADIAIEAEAKRAAGELLDPLEESLLS